MLSNKPTNHLLETDMNTAYIDYAAKAFELMSIFGLVLTQAEALDIAEKQLAKIHPAHLLAQARETVEANIQAWGGV